MSAYIVSHDHIDAILTIAASSAGKYPGDTSGSVEWWRNDPREVSFRDLEGGSIRPSQHPDDLTEVGRMLLEECGRSVAYRYPDDGPEELPGYGERPSDYTYRRVLELEPDPVVGLSLIACLRYQSCEHPGWSQSEAYRFCEGFEAAMVRRLPGYNEAPWHYRREGVAA